MKSFGRWLWDWAKSIAVALVVWFFLRTFLVEAFRIPSGSMENTLLIGDFLFVNKLLYGAEVPLLHKRLPAIREPHRGDILVFDSVEEQGLKVVKRLIGVPERRADQRALGHTHRSERQRGSIATRADATLAGTSPGARSEPRQLSPRPEQLGPDRGAG